MIAKSSSLSIDGADRGLGRLDYGEWTCEWPRIRRLVLAPIVTAR